MRSLSLAIALSMLLATQPNPVVAVEAAESQSSHDHMMGKEGKAERMNMMAGDERLAELVEAMRNAEGQEKVDALTAVVEELVTRRQQMHEMGGMMCQSVPCQPFH